MTAVFPAVFALAWRTGRRGEAGDAGGMAKDNGGAGSIGVNRKGEKRA